MVNNELSHAGTKGMKWGQRLYQYKDGSLTPLGRLRYNSQVKKAAKAEAKARAEAEAIVKKRAKLLDSTDAEDLYKNRNLLSTSEIKERLDRINTEQRLKDLTAKPKKDRYEGVDKVLKFGRKVNEVYEFTNTPVMKQIKKKLFGGNKVETDAERKLRDALKNVNNISDDDLSKIIGRATKESTLKNLVDKLDK